MPSMWTSKDAQRIEASRWQERPLHHRVLEKFFFQLHAQL